MGPEALVSELVQYYLKSVLLTIMPQESGEEVFRFSNQYHPVLCYIGYMEVDYVQGDFWA